MKEKSKNCQLICRDARQVTSVVLMQVLAFRSVLQAWWGYSVLQGLEPSLKKVRLPQNMRLLQELVRCKNSCQLYKSIIQIQKLRRAESKKTCRVPKMMPCSIKVRRDWRLNIDWILIARSIHVISVIFYGFIDLLLYVLMSCVYFQHGPHVEGSYDLRMIPEQDNELTQQRVYCSCVEAILGSRSSGHLSASCRTKR